MADQNYKFTATVTAFAAGTIKRMQALVISSTVDLIEIAQTPTGKGGKMRVDTGFLRASGVYSFNGLPSGPARGAPDQQYNYNPVAEADLAGFNLGQTIWFGWTANYAKYREAYDGFLISALQRWQEIVDKRCEEIQRRSPNGGSQ